MSRESAFLPLLVNAVLPGFAIGTAGIGALVWPGPVGAVTFCFGLLAVVHYSWPLYTGAAGFVRSWRDMARLPAIIAGNVAGAYMAAALAPDSCRQAALGVVIQRLDAGPWRVCALALFCGFIMTAAVRFAREGRMLPLVFGVPLFVLCGFAHSIADAFYIAASGGFVRGWAVDWPLVAVWLAAVVGNFLGCNLHRVNLNGDNYDRAS